MTDEELDQIEASLQSTLPAEYRQLSREFPFRAVGNDVVYWFFDTPQEVIHNTRSPLGGFYEQDEWSEHYLVIGHSPAGDAYFLDTSREASPVFLLSHETQTIEEEYPSLNAFKAEWTRESALSPPEDSKRERLENSGSPGCASMFGILMLTGGYFLVKFLQH